MQKLNKKLIICQFFYITVSLLLISSFGFAKEKSFSRIYKGNGNDLFYSVKQCRDGGYIAAGTKEVNTNNKSDFWIVKTDKNGETVWEKTYGGTGWDRVNDLCLTKDKGYILVGETILKHAQGRLVKVIKLKEDGTLLWEKTFSKSDDNEANSVIEIEDGELVITGSLFYQEKKSSYLWVLKLSEDGDVIWNNTYGGSTWDTGRSICRTHDKGYIISGVTEDEETGLKDIWIVKLNKRGQKVWEKIYGRYYWDAGNSIQQTSDHNYIVAGYTYSGDTKKSLIWILYLDKKGNKVWDKILGGKDWDNASAVKQTIDGDFIVVGYTKEKGAGEKDLWILKIDKKGEIIWERVYGNMGNDEALSVQNTTDGGYIIAGYTVSFEADIKDGWLLKVDRNGNLPGSMEVKSGTYQYASGMAYSHIWNITYGSKDNEKVLCSAGTPDNGYILAGYSAVGKYEGREALIIKINRKGDQQWSKVYKWGRENQVNALLRNKDNRYIGVGYVISEDKDNSDIWVFEFNNKGEIVWNKIIGGEAEEKANAVCQTEDGGYMIAGFIHSKEDGEQDMWIIKLDKKGKMIWEKKFNGKGDDEAFSILPAGGDQYIVAGNTFSKEEAQSDIWILKLAPDGEIVREMTYGGIKNDGVYSMQRTSRGGYIAAGYTRSEKGDSDFLIIRLSRNGNIIWSETYSRSMYDAAWCITQTKEEGFIAAGTTLSKGAGGRDIWILRLDGDGKMIWNKTYGKMGKESVSSIYQTPDNRFILSGSTSSKREGKDDFLVIKFQEEKGRNELYIVTDPPLAKIYLNNEFRGLSPVELLITNRITNNLIIRKENYYDTNADIITGSINNDRLFYKLRMKAGILSVISLDSDVNLTIDRDQKRVIKQNRTTDILLKQGEHFLEFKDDVNNKRSILINISLNNTNVMVIDEDFFKKGESSNRSGDSDKGPE